MNTENYNETVLIPLLEKRVHELTSALLMAEARVQIAQKEVAAMQKKLQETATPVEAVVE